MFNKATLLVLVFVASSVLAAPVPDNSNDIFQECIQQGFNSFECAQQADIPPTCDKGLVTSNLAELQQTVTSLQNVDVSFPDLLATDEDGVTIKTVLTALDAATKANAAGDFAGVVSGLQTVVNTTDTFLGPLEGDGLESAADLDVNDTATDTLAVAKLCASS